MIQEIIKPLEFEEIIPEIIFNLDRDSLFPDRKYPDIRYIGGYKDGGHDAVSIIWEKEKENNLKEVFAFSKRKDWKTKIREDLKKRKNDGKTINFIYVTTEKVGIDKLPENLSKLENEFGFSIDVIDIDDLILWLDNTDWGKTLKMKYGINDEDILIYLKPNDKILLSDEKTEEYFRFSGPALIDFIKDIIYKRKEVNQIISKINDNRIHIISGHSGSGKTVLARYISFELKESYQIYWLNMADIIRDRTRVYLEMKKIDHDNVLLIIEDVHESPSEWNEVIRYFNSNIRMLRLVTTTRTIDKDQIIHFNEISNLFDNLNYHTKINAGEVSQELISFYTDKLKIERPLITEKFEYCSKDLWILVYLLKACKEKKESHENIIHEKVHSDLIKYNELIGDGASDIILIISLITQNSAISGIPYNDFNRIPIDDYFLLDKLGYDSTVLTGLLQRGLVRKIDFSSYWCWHTSLSRLYVDVAEKYPDILSRINSKFREMLGDSFDDEEKLYFNTNMFHVYLRIHPEYTDKILSILGTSSAGGIFNLFNSLKTREIMYSQLKKGTLKQINSIIYILNHSMFINNPEVLYDKLTEEFGPDVIEEKINQCDDPVEIIYYAQMFYRIDKEIGLEILEQFKDKIIKDIHSCKNTLFEIIDGIDLIKRISEDIAYIVYTGIKKSLSDKIMSASFGEIAFFFNNIKELNNVSAQEEVGRYWDIISKKVAEDKTDHIVEFLCLISTISKIDNMKGKKLIDIVGESNILDEIKIIDNVDEIGQIIDAIDGIDQIFKFEILSLIIHYLETEINKKGIGCLRNMIASLHKNNINMCEELLKSMNQDEVNKMKKEYLFLH